MSSSKLSLWFATVLLIPFGCRAAPPKDNPLGLTAKRFVQGGKIPSRFTCYGANLSPALSWNAPPPGTRTFAVIVFDSDTISHFPHWEIFNIPARERGLEQGVPDDGKQLPDGAKQGKNGFGRMGYAGPCPPGKSVHHYHFVLYALDSELDLPAGSTRQQIEQAMRGHILAESEVAGIYHRPPP